VLDSERFWTFKVLASRRSKGVKRGYAQISKYNREMTNGTIIIDLESVIGSNDAVWPTRVNPSMTNAETISEPRTHRQPWTKLFEHEWNISACARRTLTDFYSRSNGLSSFHFFQHLEAWSCVRGLKG